MTLDEALDRLAAAASADEKAKLARYGIPDDRAMGVAMRDIIALGREIGTDHALARALWADGRYEVQSLAAFVGDPAALTGAEMDAWAADFDNWAICDTLCFRLFDRAPMAWDKVHAWSGDDRLYVRRAGMALIWALSVHDKTAPDQRFLDALPLIEAAAADDRDHVWKGASMALRATGKRNDALLKAARTLAETLTDSKLAHSARVGRETLKDLSGRGSS